MFVLIADAKSNCALNFWPTHFISPRFLYGGHFWGCEVTQAPTSELVVRCCSQPAGDFELHWFCSASRLSDGSSRFKWCLVLCLTSFPSTVIISYSASMSTNVAANFLRCTSVCLFRSYSSTAVGPKISGTVSEVLIACSRSFKWNSQQSLAVMKIRGWCSRYKNIICAE